MSHANGSQFKSHVIIIIIVIMIIVIMIIVCRTDNERTTLPFCHAFVRARSNKKNNRYGRSADKRKNCAYDFQPPDEIRPKKIIVRRHTIIVFYYGFNTVLLSMTTDARVFVCITLPTAC